MQSVLCLGLGRRATAGRFCSLSQSLVRVQLCVSGSLLTAGEVTFQLGRLAYHFCVACSTVCVISSMQKSSLFFGERNFDKELPDLILLSMALRLLPTNSSPVSIGSEAGTAASAIAQNIVSHATMHVKLYALQCAPRLQPRLQTLTLQTRYCWPGHLGHTAACMQQHQAEVQWQESGLTQS